VVYSTLPVDRLPSSNHTVFIKLDEEIINGEWKYIARNIWHDIRSQKNNFDFNYAFSFQVCGNCPVELLILSKYDDDDGDAIPDQLEDLNGLDRLNPWDGGDNIKAFVSGKMNASGIIDTDNDGLDDNWEVSKFGDLTQSTGGDYNGDGITNVEEYFLALDPSQSQASSGSMGLVLYNCLQ